MEENNFFVKKFKNIIKLLNRIVLIPIRLGSIDAYPSLSIPNNFIIKRFYSSSIKRINFWTKIARLYPSFKPFYNKEHLSDYLRTKNIEDNHIYINELKNLYEDGYVKINNFFNNQEHNEILRLFDEKLSNKLSDNSDIGSYQIKDKKINDMLYKKFSFFENILFGKKLKKQSYILKQIAVSDNKSPYKDSTHWHQDRFIPCFKLLYFPTSVTTNPFEYLKGSHFIDKQYFKNALISALNTAGSEDLSKSLNFKGYKRETFYVKDNTLIIAATSGFHRRYNENKVSEKIYNCGLLQSFYMV